MSFLRWTTGLLACSSLVTPALAQKPFKHALPAKTLVFVSAPDINSSIEEFMGTALAKMWREEEMQDFVGDALKMAKEQIANGMAQLAEMHEAGHVPITPAEVKSLRVHGLTAALTSFAIGASDSGKPQPKVGLLIHLDLGPSAATWRKVVDFGLAALVGKAGEKVERSSVKLDGDVELITIAPTTANTEMSLNVAFIGNGLIIGSLPAEVKNAVAAVLGQKTILPKDADYVATTTRLGTGGAEIEGYVAVSKFMDVMMDGLKMAEENAPNWPEELNAAGIGRALTALGMRSVTATGFTTKYEGKKSVTRAFALSPVAQRRGFAAAGGKSVDVSFLKWVPKDVASVSSSTLDLGGIYDGLIGALKAYDPQNPDLAKMLLGKLAELEEQFDISLKDDLFGVFGDQIVSWSMGVSSLMSPPEASMLIKVKDQERLLATLKKLAAMTGGMVDFPDSERRGVKTWRLEIDADSLPPEVAPVMQVMQMMQPCFAFKKGYMVLALSTGDVRRTIKRMDREDDPKTDIRSNREFAVYFADLQQKNVNSFAWTDWKVSFESLYSALTSALALLVSDDQIPFNMTLLPEAETLSQHLFSSMTTSRTTDEGHFSTSTSPIGPEVVVGVGLVAVGAGVAFAARGQMAPGPVAATEPAPAGFATDDARPAAAEKKAANKKAAEKTKKRLP